MSELTFREVSPEAPELQPILGGLFGEYAARYGDYFARLKEQELTEWYLPPQGLFIVLERDGEIIAMGAYKPYDLQTAELKRIWTRSDLRRQGLAWWSCRSWSVGPCRRATSGCFSPPASVSPRPSGSTPVTVISLSSISAAIWSVTVSRPTTGDCVLLK